MVVGSGPNGLVAALRLARAGCRVEVLEGSGTPGGGVRSAELTLPGFIHDSCAAAFPLGAGSPALRTFNLARHGLEWCAPPAALAHPFDDGRAALLWPSLDDTARALGRDRAAWLHLFTTLVQSWDDIAGDILGPPWIPSHPAATLRFALGAVQSASGLASRHFAGREARALFAGCAAHGFLPLSRHGTAAFGLVLTALGQACNWPFVAGGAGQLSQAMVRELQSLGGSIRVGHPVESWADLPPADAWLFDTSPRDLGRIAGKRLTARYRRAIKRWRHGPGVFKLDLALDGPVPWAAPECARAGTVHLGGTIEEIAASEAAIAGGRVSARPFVLVTQPSLFDASRAPAGSHTLWTYCHVPNGSTTDMTDAIEAQLERFAPGVRRRIVGRATRHAMALEAYNPNFVGGDINGGRQDLRQILARPLMGPAPYRAARGIYLCSASTPPGGGVHGMCGWHAAEQVLRDVFDREP